MRAYMALFRMRFINSLQYRAAALAGLLTQLAWGAMELLAFSAFYRANPAAFPMTFQQTVNYIWLQQAFIMLFMLWFFEADIFESITGGGIAYVLSRPMGLYGRWACQAGANRLAKALLRSVPLLTAACFVPPPYRLTLPPNALQGGLFILSAGLSFGVVIALSMLVYISTFFTLSPMGVRVILSAASDLLSGAVIPLPFFPAQIRAVVELLPFAAMQNMPLRIYSGHIAGAEALTGIGLQVAWLCVLTVSGRAAMRAALRRVVAQGG